MKIQKPIEKEEKAYIEACLRGEAIYGDDFKGERLKNWFAEEMEAYSGLSKLNTRIYKYGYHALNWKHGFQDDELLPIQYTFNQAILLEPSKITKSVLDKKKIKYFRPMENGSLPFPNKYFDLMISLGVIHHLPRVSFTLRELGRVALPGGILLLREPITSMGDWRVLRPGLTKNERGIPEALLRIRLKEAGFIIKKWNYVMFPLVSRIAHLLDISAYNSSFIVNIDAILSAVTKWNLKYYARTTFEKIMPSCVFAVLEKEK